MKSQLINYEVALALITALSLISQVNAQASCSPSSPQCCWVVRLWELMKAATTVSSSSATACCSSPGRIPGVVCSGSTVLELNWNNLELTGAIPQEIGKLVNLKTLDLRSNQLSESIPASIGNLTNLQTLILGSNKFSGPIPSDIGKLVNLKSLDLLRNQLSESIPASIGNLTNLQHLNLGSNQFSGPIPEWIGNLTKLKQLNLRSNQLSESIPKSIGQMASLEYLFVNNNPDLTGEFYRTYCKLNIFAADTNLFICGEAAKSSPPTTFSTAGISLECASTTGTCSPLVKRTQVQNSGLYPGKMSCNYDDNKNPFADCFSTLTYLYSTNKHNCKKVTDDFFANFGPLWQDLRTSCARWVRGNSASSPTSNACTRAKQAVVDGATYNKKGETVPVGWDLVNNLSPVWSLAA